MGEALTDPVIRAREIESVLEPGERLLWEGRPTRWPPRIWRHVALIVLVVALYTGVVALGIRMASRPLAFMPAGGTSTGTVKWELFGGSVGVTRTETWAGPGGTGTATTGFHALSPLAIPPLAVAIEIVLIARWRARRYRVTDRRVIAIGRGKLEELARPITDARVEKRALIVRSGEGKLALEDLDDPEAARSAIEG